MKPIKIEGKEEISCFKEMPFSISEVKEKQ